MVSTTTEQVAPETVMVETKTIKEPCEVEKDTTTETTTTITADDWEKAQKTFQLGKKNLFLNKYDESVNNIEEACQAFTAKYGEFDANCADVYFFYGRALLELARVENTVLGNALSGVPEEETEPINDSRYGNPDDCSNEEKKEISEKVISALCDEEKPTTEEVKTVEPTTETPAETKVEEKEEKMVEGDKPAEITKETEAAIAEAAVEGAVEEEQEEEEENEEECDEEEVGDDEAAKDEAEAEEISNLQRAWEMFELAKLVYTKNFDNDLTFKNKRIAECLIKLGEISIEQEIYTQAIQDIGESIKIQEAESAETRDERMLAETFYQLALAQQFGNYFTEATESYQKSINIMQFRIEKIKGKMAALKEDEPDFEAQKKACADEIAEMEATLPEMQCKLEETTEQAQQSVNMIKEAVISTMTGTTTGEETTPVQNGDVKDITGMLKSKRKISSSSLDEGSKKTRLSSETAEITAVEAKAPLAEPEKMTPECPAPTTTEEVAKPETVTAV